jgi:NADH-quinone oxidoreductase chain G
MKFFKINNIKFNYNLEFQSNQKKDQWKINAPLIEYCETLGITIPHYCYHKNLSISGNCRMCLVELKNSPKPVVSCALNAKSCLNNSELYTNSPLVKKSRENVLEFLLLNHPLDCPVCDQGGECDLQEQSFFFGMSKKRFYNFKRVVMDKNLGLIVKTVMTRCIHCTRCIRFAREIAGVNDLGIFGRGLNSEVGTYVQKTFKSELSGNVVDLCPVGALTSKLYPFVSRSWELKNINSIDFSDGFGLNINLNLKNNKIIKINPGFNHEENSITWISDKTRFSFDGMFSPERVLEGFIIYGNKTCKTSIMWEKLLNEIINTLYFEDHLNRHFLKSNNLLIVFDSTISLEVLNLLMLFSKKYFFITLRTSEGNFKNNDLETNLTTNATTKLKSSNLCMFFGVNSKYEGSYLNLKLRQRYLKGNFKIISINSLLDLTVPVNYFGLNIKNIKSLFEGNSFLCQDLVNSSNPLLIFSSKIYNRKDFSAISSLINFLKSKNYILNYENVSTLSSSINEVGVHYVKGFNPLTVNDLEKSNGIYFLNTNVNKSSQFSKIVNLKVLNYFKSNSTNNSMYCFENNNSIITNTPKNFLTNYSISNYINLPNNVFFGTNSTYLTTNGYFKKVTKILSSEKQIKEDWQILRKIFSYSNNISFSSNIKYNQLINFSNNTLHSSRKILNCLYIASRFSLTNQSNILKEKISGTFNINRKKIKIVKSKLYTTNLKIWIKDFYIGGTDNYSNKSINMINSSKLYRYQTTNFNILTYIL